MARPKTRDFAYIKKQGGKFIVRYPNLEQGWGERTESFTDKKLAEKKAATLNAENELKPEQVATRDWTVGNAINYWRKMRLPELAKENQKIENARAEFFRQQLGAVKIIDLSDDEYRRVEHVIKRRYDLRIEERIGAFRKGELKTKDGKEPKRKKLGQRAINGYFTLLRSILNYARDKKHTPNFTSMADFIKPVSDRLRIASEEEIKELLAACEVVNGKKDNRKHLAWVIRFMLYTGGRPDEIFRLKIENFDFEQRVINMPNAKYFNEARETREIAFNKKIESLIDGLRLREFADDVYVFGEPVGRKVPLKSVDKAWLTACRIAGIEDLHLYDFRAKFITTALLKGASPYEIGKVVGHSAKSVIQYQKYFRLVGEHNRKTMAMLDD